MKSVAKLYTGFKAVLVFTGICTLVNAHVAVAQTHCSICGPYQSQCQGAETYINLNGSGSTGAGTLSFSWSTDCPDSDLLNPTSPMPTLILYGPGHGASANCKVYLEVNDHGGCGSCQGKCSCIDQCETEVTVPSCQVDCEGTIGGTKVLDRCGVCGGDGNSCLGCNNVDILQNQFALDGNALGQRKLVEHATNNLSKLARSAKDKAFVTKARKDAKKFYNDGWTLAWSLPSIVTTCSNQVFCTSISNAGTVNSFLSASDGSNKLLKSVIAKLQKLRKKKLASDSKTLAKGDALYQANIGHAAAVPATASACTSGPVI